MWSVAHQMKQRDEDVVNWDGPTAVQVCFLHGMSCHSHKIDYIAHHKLCCLFVFLNSEAMAEETV